MAYAALVSLSQTIHELLHDQGSISFHEKQQIISTRDHIIFLKGFLQDFPEKAISLEERIRDAANEAEDIIEYFMWNRIWWRNYAGEWIAAVCGYIKRWFRSDLSKLENITMEIDWIASEAMEMKNSAGVQDLQLDDASYSSSSSSRMSKDTAMVGFEDDLMAIKARLCGEPSKLHVIPICGMGGIGKTTLARNAYDDPLTVEYFQIRAWVTVSKDYSAKEVLLRLLISIEEKSSQRSNESEIEENVYKRLKGKRYLVVMDDMWSTKTWDDVRMILPDDHNGSRIVLTTRLSDVAAYPDSCSHVHKMSFMDANQSWNLLRQKVFCPPELEDIGKRIATSCRGLPLAVAVVAGLLSTVSKTRASWESIARNVGEAVTRNDEQFAEIILSSSYNQLPHHLRPCFLYMGSFPKDYEIRASKLIKLWVAERFLELRNGCKSHEDEAEEYLEDLVKRSLVLITRRKSNGKIKSCSIHDLVRDLCIRKSFREKFFANFMDIDAIGNAFTLERIQNLRRQSTENQVMIFFEVFYGERVHTIICFQQQPSEGLKISIGSLRLLRVFEMVNYKSRFDELNTFFETPHSLPDQVFELFHLRYLSIDFIPKIPASILKLQNLQTLIIDPRSKLENLQSSFIHARESFMRKYWRSIVYLPSEIWRMPQLRHLVSFISCCFSDPEGEACALENLQTLSVSNLECSQSTVKMIPNLKKLGISYVSELCFKNFHLDNLVHLLHLEKLKLEVHENFPYREKLNHVFPRTLKRLTLSGWPLPWKDMGVRVGSLPNLEVLKLRSCPYGNEWETSEGEFPQLKFLLIQGSFLQQWTTESSHFPSLKCLVLRYCWDLKEIPDGIGEIPTLEMIEVYHWDKLLVDSAKRIQEEQQQNWGNDALQVRIV